MMPSEILNDLYSSIELIVDRKIQESSQPLPPPSLPATTSVTAAELSKPGALQAYVSELVAKNEPVQLPPGQIKGNIVINRDAAIIRGSGCPYGDRIRGTVITPEDITKPTIQIRDALGVKIQDLGLLNCGDVGISIEGSNGFFVFHTVFDDVAICRAKVGIRVSELPGTRIGQNTAADVRIRGCRMTRCERAVEVNHPQAVNIHITDQSYFYSCDTVAWINNGGRLLIENSCANPTKCWVKIVSGGGNQMPYILRNLYSDRSGGAPMPILCDASTILGGLMLVVDGYSCSYQTHLDGPAAENTHLHIITPKATWAKDNFKIDIRSGWNAVGTKF